MSRLVNLLKDLGEDAALEAEYKKDPESVMRRYQLSDEEVQAMKAKDLDEIKRLSGLDKVCSNGTIKCYD